ncbi:MAG: 50S ribosomal protein L10 [Candidatus Brocadiae bacterium]|nr:50S ribosomal protein L10 [Candidatus Brocadiia bacterium]
MPQEVKELMLTELEEKFRDIKQTGCVLVDYQGVKAGEARALRQVLRLKGGEMIVVKNSLFALAMERLGVGELNSLLEGPIALVRGANAIEAAKAAEEMASAHRGIKLRGAYVDGSVVGAEGVQRLARIPGREVLLSMLAGAMLAPLRRLAFGLLAKPRALLSALDQLKERAAGESPAEQQGDEP